MSKVSDELLPCPFCGSPADPEGWSSIDRKGPACTNAKCNGSADSAEAWNRRSASTPAKAVRVTDETGDVGLEPQREDAVAAIEIKMTPIAEALPVRDGMRGEQTILTYNDKVGTWGISFMEAGWDDYGSSFALGVTHWLDITSMWPGVIAQVASFAGKPIAWTSERELLRAANGNAGRLFANEDEDFAVPLYAHPTPAPNVPESQTVSALEDAPQQEANEVEAVVWRLSDEDLRHIADSKDVASCRYRIKHALIAALSHPSTPATGSEHE